MNKKLARVRAQALKIADNPEMSESAKSQNINKMIKKVKRSENHGKVYSVTRHAGGSSRLGPKQGGVRKNARTTVVDRRLKKDKRGLKTAARFGRLPKSLSTKITVKKSDRKRPRRRAAAAAVDLDF